MNNRVFWTRFFLVASILTAIAIFFFSAQSGEDSAELSDDVTLAIVRVIRPDFENLSPVSRQSFLESLGLAVRKCAHFSEFALLGLNLAGFFLAWQPGWDRRRAALAAWITVTLYAATDEAHQMFVEQRVPAPLDVGIDSAGALTGVLVMALILHLILRRQEKSKAVSN